MGEINIYKRILVPLDGSEEAEGALVPATSMAAAFAARLSLLQVCEPEEGAIDGQCRGYLLQVYRRLQDTRGIGDKVTIETLVNIGKPAERIVELCDREQNDIVVMTCCGRSGGSWGIGATCQRVLQKSRIPVMMIRVKHGTAAPEHTLERILVPLDLSERSKSIVDDVASLHRGLGSQITLLNVVAAGKEVHTIGGLNYVPFRDQDLASMKERSMLHLKNIAAGRFSPGTAAVEVKAGDPAAEIIKAAISQEATMIAMSSHGHSGIERWAFGSVTQKVIHGTQHSFLLHRQASS
ncbi:MAG: universal stress protein [Chloroflexi bacterium]|nr:universal stress protein [Chloroflexota bacterium]